MNALERYLRRATRGLYGAVKQDVWNELEQDVQERVRVARAFGLSEEQALQRALEQLGDPREVSSGMNKTYVWPRALRVGALAALGAALLLSVPSAARAVLPALSLLSAGDGTVLVPEGGLLQALEAQGVPLSAGEVRADPLRAAALKLLPPDAILVTESDSAPYVVEDTPQTELAFLARAARAKGYAVQVSGWQTLEVKVDRAQFAIQPQGGQANFARMYEARLLTALARGQKVVPTVRPDLSVLLKGQRPEWAGRVLLLASLEPIEPPRYTRYVTGLPNKTVLEAEVPMLSAHVRAVQVGADGRFELRLPAGRLARLSNVAYAWPNPGTPDREGRLPRNPAQGLYLGLYDPAAYGTTGEFKDLPQTTLPAVLESGKTYTL